MASSRFGAVTDALVTLIGTAGSTTFDGPPLTADVPTDYVIVGGTEDPDDDAGDIDQDWAALGKASRNETGTVTCAILAGTGDDIIKTARDRALTILANIETALRADPSLTGVLSPGWCHITSATPKQVRNDRGLYVRIRFTVTYKSRI